MLIKFSRDYRGKLTKELFYLADTIIDIDDGAAEAIIAEGAAVAVDTPTEDEPADEAPKAKRRKKAVEE